MAAWITRLGALIAVAAVAAGCAGTPESPALSLPSVPTVASISAIGSAIVPGPSERPVGNATDLYSRIGRGAVACWFGAKGPLKLSYIYHAEAEPPSRGGKAEIIIHQREPGQPNPRGAKAFQVAIEPSGETATVATVNLKMPEPMGRGMTHDVERWTRGETGCASAEAVAGWTPKAPEPAPVAKPQAGKSTKGKAKTAAIKPANP